ncbi:MAG: chromosomal replication initiator protein DnaA [Chloroflexota bacterium]
MAETRSAQEIWEIVLGELQLQVSKANYRTWLEKTIGIRYQGSEFAVGVPNTFVAEYLDRNQRSLIEKTLIGITRQNTRVVLQVNGHELKPGVRSPEKWQAYLPGFNPKYTFNTFVVGNGNRLAHAAALGAAENPGHSYNPLFLYGGVGLGKTHLLHAIGQAAQAQAGNLRVLYVSAEQFTNELVQSIQEKRVADFRQRYRSADMLLVDDIQFFGGKEQTEENFFHTFNELHNNSRQIVISGDRAPKAIPLLQERLRSRFEWGLAADIQPPDFETRMGILEAKAGQQNVPVGMDVLEVLAQRVQSNIRELEGSLNRVIAYARLLRAAITPELARQALQDIVGRASQQAAITPGQILELVAGAFQVSPLAIKSPKRDKQTVVARQVAMYLLKQESECSLSQIGKEMGNRSPATVMYSLEKVAADMGTDPSLRHQVQELAQSLRQG